MSYIRPDSRYPNNWNRIRFYVFSRDKYTCQICGRANLSKPNCHHIIPIGRGGSSNPSNLITVCRHCHERIHHI